MRTLFFWLRSTAALLMSAGASLLFATPLPPILLWETGAPETVTLPGPETNQSKPGVKQVANQNVIRIGNVSEPTLTFYPAPVTKNTGTTVLVCPGGGYWILAYDLEGSEICQWLNEIGINAALLKYRVPRRKGRPEWEAPLEDASRAMQILRSNAADWDIEPDKIGVIGFSAGGHLAATLSNTTTMPIIEGLDNPSPQSVCPNFAVLVYPAYLTDKETSTKISPEVQPSTNTPPTFIVVTMDDSKRAEEAMHYAMALKSVSASAELHIYPTGGHGYGLRKTANPLTDWTKRVEDWLRYNGFFE